MSRDAPDLLARLPEQYFMGILARSAAAAAQDGPRFIDLGRGNPDLAPPAHALAALRDEAYGGYPPFQGLPSLREAIAERYAADHGVVLDPEREVAVVPGTKTGIMLVALAAARSGGTVLLPDPGYPDYPSGVALAGGTAAPLPLDPDGWQPLWDGVPDADLAILNYPSNPVAACEAPGTFEAAVAAARERGCWLLHDMAYGFLAFDGRRARSVLEAPGARDLAVELWSPSKIYGMAGWRAGFLVGNAELVGRVRVLIDHLHAGVWTGIQRGLEAALRSDQSDVAERAAVYLARRDRLVDGLRAAGASLERPEGSFFVWWRLPDGLGVDDLFDRARVGVAPGEGFGAQGAGHVRLSLAVADADLDEAVERIAALLVSR